MDAGSNDVFRVMDFSSRLELLAEAQARYNRLLQERGFDAEQAFALVRDWSHQAFDWTLHDPIPRPALGVPVLDVPQPLLPPDPSAVHPGEPYLLSEEEEAELPGEGGRVMRIDQHRRDDVTGLDEAA